MKIKCFALIIFLLSTMDMFSQMVIQSLDSQFNVTTNKSLVKYIRTINEINKNYFAVQINYQTGELMMTGGYLDTLLTIPQGKFTYFFANGVKESQGYYYNGQRVDVWERWNFDGTQKPSRYYTELSELLILK